MRLYHYCCSCSAKRITDRGFLRPQDGAGLFGVGLVWLTTQSVPDREALGLTMNLVKCDRLEHQYVVDVPVTDVEPWLESDVRLRCSFDLDFHDFEHGRQPETWWITRRPVFAVRNRDYRQHEAAGAVDLVLGKQF